MEYLAVFCDHNFSDLANIYYMELNENREQLRVVEKYLDGRYGYANNISEFNNAFLAKDYYPTLNDLNANPECIAKYITKNDFEFQWEKAKKYCQNHSI